MGHNPQKLMSNVIGIIGLITFACCFLNANSAKSQDHSSEVASYLKALNEQQQELGRIDDALKSGIQQIERACKPFIEKDSLETAELKPTTYLQLDQARSSIESKSDDVLSRFRNAHNLGDLKTDEVCNLKTDNEKSVGCLSLKITLEKLKNLEFYFLKTKTKNIQIFDNFVVVGKLEALNCVRPDFTNNLIQSYLQRVDKTDISGLKYYQSKLAQLKSEIQDHE